LFFIGKIMDQVYGLRDHYSLLVHGGLATMRRHGRSEAREVFTIAQREREKDEVVEVLTNVTTCRLSCRDGHMTTLNRGRWWCSDGEMVLGERRRDSSPGG
jgi:hypothetical protein